MPLAWRLTQPAFARILNGEGNRIVGARWNSPGRGVVYACANLSLSILEAYVHFPAQFRTAPPECEAVRLSIPDDATTTRVTMEELEELLGEADPIAACRAVGDRWLDVATDLMLVAPSVIVPEELNIMINPDHPDMRAVSIVSTRRFRFDPRIAAPHG
jgi:RES domain-containing protein